MAIRVRKLSEEEKSRIWSKTYYTLMTLGFSEPEAEWAANQGFTLKESIMKRIIFKRKKDISLWRRSYNMTRKEAIAALSHDVNVRNQFRGLAEEDYFSLMRIIYP